MLAHIGWAKFVLVPALLVGAAGGLVAIAARESDAAFVYRQQNPNVIETTEVESAVAKAPEPVPGGNGTRARLTRCLPGKEDAGRRNPWSCRVRYESGRRVRYKLQIDARGAWRGVNATGERIVKGCCFSVGE